MISTCFQGKPFNITVTQAYAPTTNAKEAEVKTVCKDLQDLELAHTQTKTKMSFSSGNWNERVGSQEIPGLTGKFGLGVKNVAGQRLTDLCQNTLVTANTLFQQHKRQLYTRTSPDGQYQNQIDYVLCSQRWRNSLYSQYKQNLELTVAQIISSLLQNLGLN